MNLRTFKKPEAAKPSPRRTSRVDASYGAPMTSHSPPESIQSTGPAFSHSLDRVSLFPQRTFGRHDDRASADSFEAEANSVGAQVVRMPSPEAQGVAGGRQGTQLRKVGHCGFAEPFVPSPVPPSVQNVLSQIGRPMDAPTRGFMESRFGRDLGLVRIHTDAASTESAWDLQARAYAAAPHVVFAEGEFAPASLEGKGLLAHELTHVLQQGDGSRKIQRSPATDQRFKEDVKAARYRGRLIAQRIKTHGKLSKEAEAKIQSELAYFQGAARGAYRREIQPALDALKPMEMPRPVELFPRSDDPQYCRGSKCLSDDDIYAGLKKSEADDRAREAQATEQRQAEAVLHDAVLHLLNADVDRTMRGSSRHYHAVQRRDTFVKTGHDPGPYVNYDGGPGPVNIAGGIAGAVLLPSLAPEVAAAEIGAEAAGVGTTTATVAAPVVGAAATPQGQQAIEDVGEALDSVGPAIENDVPEAATSATEDLGQSLNSEGMGRVIGWGEGKAADAVAQTEAVAESLTSKIVQSMAERGLTKEWVVDQLSKYTAAFAKGGPKLRNVQLIPRMNLMMKILDLWTDE